MLRISNDVPIHLLHIARTPYFNFNQLSYEGRFFFFKPYIYIFNIEVYIPHDINIRKKYYDNL